MSLPFLSTQCFKLWQFTDEVVFVLSSELVEIAEVSANAQDVLAWQPKVLVATPFADLLVDEDRNLFSEFISKKWNVDRPATIELSLTGGDQKLRTCLVKLCQFDNIKALLVRDISLEKENMAQARKLAKLSQNVPGVLFQFQMFADGSFNFPYVSPTSYEVLGIPHSDLENRFHAVAHLIIEEDLRRLKRLTEESFKATAPIEWVGRIKLPGGRISWVQARSIPEKLNDGSVVWDGILINLDERMHSINELREANEKLRLSLNGAGMGTWEWDLERQDLIWDDRMYLLHHIPKKDYPSIAAEVSKYMLPEELEYAQHQMQICISTGSVLNLPYQLKTPQGDIRHLRVFGKKVQQEDGRSRFYGVAWDETEEVRVQVMMEEQRGKLISSAKMAALGEMSGGIAHEINNPLTVIQARSFQLAQLADVNKLDPPKVRQIAESISKTADKIAKIIRSLRSFARDGANDPFDMVLVHELVNETLEFCKTRFYNNGVEVTIADIPLDIEVECRLIQIEQVILNLLNNSFDAIQGLPEKWIKIHTQTNSNFVDIVITDSGSGIPRDVAEKMMQPFFTTKEVGRGTGLGLSISAGIVKTHGGELIYDASHTNTRFIVRLPIYQGNKSPTINQ